MIPYPIPPFSPSRAQLLNALSARALPWSFPLGSGVCVLDAGADAPPAPFAAACAAHVRVGDGLWRVELGALDLLLLHPALAEAGGEALLPDLPEGLVLAVLEHLFGPLLDRAAAWLRTTVRFDGAPSSFDAAGCLALTLTLPAAPCGKGGEAAGRAGSVTVPLLVHYPDDEAARYVAARLDDLPRRRRDVSSLPVTCSLEAGSLRLAPAELRGLETGDVLLPEAWHPEKPLLRLPDGTRFVCRAAEGALVVVGPDVSNPASTEVPMSADAPQAAESASEAAGPSRVDVDGLELTVRFELARLTLSVGEVAALAPGYAFALDSDPAAPVTVRVGDKAVAEGRLVDLNGTLGVQITRIADPAAAPGAGPSPDSPSDSLGADAPRPDVPEPDAAGAAERS